jgi:uncharacterized protein involved in response to NO
MEWAFQRHCLFDVADGTMKPVGKQSEPYRPNKMPASTKAHYGSWKALASAPHRIFFLGGACQGIAAMLWWLLELSGRFGGSYPFLARTILPVWAHAYVMIYGFFPFFIFGFLFTFFPNWLDAGRVSSWSYLLSFFAIGSGAVLFYVGLIIGKPILLLAVLLVLSGWGIGAASLIRILLPARSSEKVHLSLMILFIIFGAVGLLSLSVWLFLNNPVWLKFALVVGIWFFLLPLIVTMSHLVIPFFSKAVLKNYRVVQPMSILWILLAGIFIRGLLEWMEWRGAFWIPDLILLLPASYLSLVWGFRKSVAIKMLFMLHLSFSWFSIAIVLDLLQSLTFVGSRESLLILGLAPLHALTIGFFSNMVIGMSTRVTLGHFGRPVAVDETAWRLFLTFQIAAILRVSADLFPTGGLLSMGGYGVSALLWMAGFFFWLLKYGPLLWRPGLPVEGRQA